MEKGYHLNPGDSPALNNIQLGVNTSEVQVVVFAEAQRIDTTSGETSSLITASDIDHLAVEGRDVTELFKILPGFAIAMPQSINNTAYDPSQVGRRGRGGRQLLRKRHTDHRCEPKVGWGKYH